MMRKAHSTVPTPLLVQRRSIWMPYIYASINEWRVPNGADPTDKKTEELRNMRFHTKPRTQWNYNRIDDNVNVHSEFRKVHNRPDFDGPREDNWTAHNASYKNPPHVKPLHSHFDKYNEPGYDQRTQAAMAVVEAWDSSESYYPGENWQQNRPSFRSVPKEILNKQTSYHVGQFLRDGHKVKATWRNRAWNPIWPPPGYKVAPMATKKEFTMGAEDAGLTQEIERWYWYKMWSEANFRMKSFEIAVLLIWMYVMYLGAKNHYSNQVMFDVMANRWYPGQHLMRFNGEAAEEGGQFWWQTPMEDWPVQHMLYVTREMRFGYANHLKREAAKQEVEAVL